MKCTITEFQNKIFANQPPKYFSYEAATMSNYETYFVLDTDAECNLPYHDKMKIASHIWMDGEVHKDSDGTFPSLALTSASLHGRHTSPAGYSLQVYSANNQGLPVWTNLTLDNKSNIFSSPSKSAPKCECGKEKHGFANHSTWCDVAKEQT